MSSLNFSQVVHEGKNAYATEITADDAVNVHIERDDRGYILVYQRGTSTGEWAITRAFGKQSCPEPFDVNLVSDVYPMYWKIVSQVEVKSGTLTEG